MPERVAPAGPGGTVGDLAIVLHSHMPYVEGFGTYPFGEEWLFEALARSYLPLLEVADRVTFTITPVLADQLEAGGVAARALEFLRRHRLGAAERDLAEGGAEAAAADGQLRSYRAAIGRIESLGAEPLTAFREPAAAGRIELVASAATHAVLPKLATTAGRRLQVDAGLRSHARRFGRPAGFWLPECAWEPGLDRLLEERAVAYTCLDQSAVEEPLAALAPARTGAGLAAFTLDWPSVELVWSARGYPAEPAYLEYHRLSPNGTRLWSIAGEPYDDQAARARAAEHAADFLARVAARLRDFSAARGRRGLVTFAIDTELLGHWWAEGPLWLGEVLERAPAAGVRLLTLSEALAEHEPEQRKLSPSSWGENKDLSTWDAPSVADLVWAARRLELRMLRALGGGGLSRAAAERAARELLAVQSSDWAFLDKRGQAGDYPYARAVTHALAMLEAIDCRQPPDARMRNLAPDLSLAPLLEP